MPRGAYTAKQDRKAEHIEKGYEKRGVSKKEAEEPRLGDGQQAGQGRQQRRPRPFVQPQRRRQEGLGNPPPPRQGLKA